MVVDAQRPRRVVARLLEWLAEQDGVRATTGLATPVERLAARLGLDVATFHPSGPRAATLGWLEPDENLIYLRADLSETARRFTLAHEIGHALLHRPGGLARLIATGTLEPPEAGESADLAACDAADFDASPELFAGGDETLSPSQAYSARARRESEANAFASCLLLPDDRLLPAYLRTRGTGLAHLRRLTGDFGVSEEVLLRRLVGLLAPVPEPDAEAPDAADTADAAGTRDETRADASASLDASQRTAAETPAPALVVAGPGTGKTSTLVARVAYLVRERGVAPSHILALTFSNKAAREMRERLERLLLAPAAELDTGLPAQEMPAVSTIHAFCGDLLRRYAPLVGLRPDFRLITETDGYLLLRTLAPGLALDYYQPLAAPALHFPALLRAISRAKDELAGPREYAAAAAALRAEAETPEQIEAAERAEEVARVYAAYQAALDARGDADFGDVVRLAVRLLREHPDVLAEVQAEHEHVLVDEFQDINRAMGVLLRTLTVGRESLWAVGDANQAIYRFRGASPANLALFGSEYPGAHLHTLRRNYRSVPAVLEAAHGFARYALHAGDEAALEAARTGCDDEHEGNGAGAGRQAITLAVAPDEAQELAGLARAISEREQAGQPLAGQVVLCRTRRQCQRVAAALNDAGIRTQLATPLLDEPEVKDLLAVLTLAADRSGMGLLRAGNITDHAYSPAEAQAVLRVARERHTTPLALLTGDLSGVPDLSLRSRRALKRLAATVARMRQAPDTVTGLARYLFGQTGIGRRLLAGLAAGDARIASKAGHAAQVLALAQAYEDQRRATLTAEPAVIHGAAWAGLLDYVRVVSVTRGEGASAQEAPGPAEGVRVMTVHASKGLEFPVVYLPGLADRRFPSQRHAQPAPLPPGLAEGMPAEEDAHLAEEACLFFVALTRARDELVLSAADRYGRTRYSLSPFVPPLIARLGAHLRRTAWTAHHDDGGELRLVSPEPVVRRAPQRARLPVAAAPIEGPLHAGEIETYSRCPRQYAYRYVYGLRPREVGLPALRHALHETLTAVRERATSGSPATLGDALALFDDQWQRELGGGAPAEFTEGEGAAEREQTRELYGDIYRRHGRAVLERLLTPSSSTEAAAADSARDEVKAGATGEAVSYDQPVLIHVGVREIEVTLDRVEAPQGVPVAASGNTGGEAGEAQVRRRAGGMAEPVRFVRHRMGRSNGSPADLRTLLYVLAAEQQSHGAPQVVQHNLTTGELEPVPLDGRRLARLRDDLGNLLAGIESGNYPARPDPNTCQGCPFLLICPA